MRKTAAEMQKCGNTLSFDMSNGRGKDLSNHIFCKTCYCNDFTSRNETEILETLKSSYSGKIIHCDRTAIAPLELDIYLPELKLAIEHDGLYWHNSEKVKPGYHVLKTRMAEKAGIRLIHVFENEWLAKRNRQVKAAEPCRKIQKDNICQEMQNKRRRKI